MYMCSGVSVCVCVLRCARTVRTGDSGGSGSAPSWAVHLSVPAALLDGVLGADAVCSAQKHVLGPGAAGPVPGLLRDGPNARLNPQESTQSLITAAITANSCTLSNTFHVPLHRLFSESHF